MSLFNPCINLYRQLTQLDLDEIFSYQTTKEVRMLDRRLGMVNWLIRAVVLVYVIGYVFLLREGYTEIEKSVGHAVSEVNGSTFSRSGSRVRPWDAVDVVQPAMENGAAFIATEIFVTAGQTRQNETNPRAPCTRHTDCPSYDLKYAECHNNFCREFLWHPGFSVSDETNTQRYTLESADLLGVWLKSSIQFPSLDDSRTFSTIGVETRHRYVEGSVPVAAETTTSTTLGDGSSPVPNYFTVGELLVLAHTSYDTVRSTGCTISVSFMWNCFVDGSSTCHPQMQVARMDINPVRVGGRGFQYSYANYYRPTAGAEETRDLYTVNGVRVLLSSRGEGKKVSITAIMLQLAIAIALLWTANMVADFLMLHVLPERKHYRTYKQERTPDFSDLRNKIAEVEGEKKKLRDRKNRFAAKLDES